MQSPPTKRSIALFGGDARAASALFPAPRARAHRRLGAVINGGASHGAEAPGQ